MSNDLKALSEKAKNERLLRAEHYRVVELSDDPRQYHRDPSMWCACGACEKLFPKTTQPPSRG